MKEAGVKEGEVIKMQDKIFDIIRHDTDFLCIGGGIAGLMAAINAPGWA